MKRLQTLLILLLVALPFCLLAQQFDKNLSTWSAKNPIEKLYVHTDREEYSGGQTIWLKGYFMSDFMPSLSSTSLYVELLNHESEVVLKKIFPVYAGTAPGQLDLPDNFSSGQYQLRAYSRVMLNQPGFTFNKRITIHGKENKDAVYEKIFDSNQLAFFPEGGNFITGIVNVVAFKSIDKNGMPLNITGDVKNSKNEIITSFKSIHDGMGSFTMVPLKNESYYATLNGFGEKYFLPQTTESGLVFNVTSSPGRKQFKIVAGGNNDLFKPAYIIGQMQNQVIFTQALQSDKQVINGSIKTEDYYSGILHLTVFNKDSMPLAERITFIDNKEYVVPAEFKADTLNTNARGLNHFTLTLKDTVFGNFSVSVTDADYENTGNRPLNIYSWLLLNSDIRGYVHNPAYYFDSNTDTIKNSIELVMMTNGWTRFKWTDAAHDKLPPVTYKDPHYIKLSGIINIEGTKRPLANKDIILFLSPVDSSKITKSISHIVSTDSVGHFEIDSLVFHGKMKLLFSEVQGKKNKFIQVKLDKDSLGYAFPVELRPLPFKDGGVIALKNKMNIDYADYINERGILLENITIESRQKTSMEKLNQEYSSGLFSGNIYSRNLDLREERYVGDIFEYLRERLPGLKISGEPGNYILNYRGGNLSYYLGLESPESSGNVSIFLNDMPVSPIILETILLSEIALVKLFPTSSAVPGGGSALVVYTKKGADAELPAFSRTDLLMYQGYTIVKEFYNPNYKKQPDQDKADNRITLTWTPDIFIEGVNAHIPVIFYNNDRTKRYKIVAEGITIDGRMLMLEKIIEP